MVNSGTTELVPVTRLVDKVTHHLSKKYNLSVLSLHPVSEHYCDPSRSEDMISFPFLFLSYTDKASKQLRAYCVSYTILDARESKN